MAAKILVIHGPNLNMLGKREPEVYGRLTMEEINERLQVYAEEHEIELKTFQSNSEGALINRYPRGGRLGRWYRHQCRGLYPHQYCHT